MIDLFDLYRSLKDSLNTNQGGHIKLNGNFERWVNIIQKNLYQKKFGDYGTSQKINDDLEQPFLTSANILVQSFGTDENVAAYPADYGHFSTMNYYTFGGKGVVLEGLDMYDHCGNKIDLKKDKPKGVSDEMWEDMKTESGALHPVPEIDAEKTAIEFVENARWATALRSRFKKPTLSAPIFTQYSKGFKVAPKGIKTVVLDYLRIPSDVHLAYTLSPANTITGQGEQIIYDKENSKQLEWSPLMMGEFIDELKVFYSTYTRDEFIRQAQ